MRPIPPNIDRTLSRIQHGQAALAVAPEINRFADLQRADIVRQLVSEYRASTLTTERLWGYVGKLALLEDMTQQIEREIRAGSREQANQLGSSNDAA